MGPNQWRLWPEFEVREGAFSPFVPFMDIMGPMIVCGRERSREKPAGLRSETGSRMG